MGHFFRCDNPKYFFFQNNIDKRQIKLSLTDFFDFTSKTKNLNSCFLFILTTTNLKIRLRNQHPIQGRVARGSQALIQNFWFAPVKWLKISFVWFCFQKCWNIIHRLLRKKTILDVNLSSGFCDLPWECEISFKTVSLTPKPWNLAGLLKCEISSTEKHTLKTSSSCMYRFT